MQPLRTTDGGVEEIVEIHDRPRSAAKSHKVAAGSPSHNGDASNPQVSGRKNARDAWITSEQNGSMDTEVPIQSQLKKDILGFIENEIKKSDVKNPYIFYEHNGPEKHLKTLSKPSSSFKEKRSPSYRRKKRHISSKYREFEGPLNGLSALEKVDDYLKEYNKDDVITLSGDLEIEHHDIDNNNEVNRDSKHKRKTRRKHSEAMQSRDVSPKVFHIGKFETPKTSRPTEFSGMLDHSDSLSTPHQEKYIDNPFSSPSPLTSPNEDWLNPLSSNHPNRVYLQRGGTFRAVAREKVFGDASRKAEEQKYFRLGTLTPLDVALLVQRWWQSVAFACFGLLAGAALMHITLISCTDTLDATHRLFQSLVTMPYVAIYFFLCMLCLLSCLDRLDVINVEKNQGMQTYVQPIILALLYTLCLLVTCGMRGLDERMVFQYDKFVNNTGTNATANEVKIPEFYSTWSHLSIFRAVLAIIGLVYLVATNPPDLVYVNLSKLLQFKHSLQSIG